MTPALLDSLSIHALSLRFFAILLSVMALKTHTVYD